MHLKKVRKGRKMFPSLGKWYTGSCNEHSDGVWEAEIWILSAICGFTVLQQYFNMKRIPLS